jgi:hypothetical protein
VEQAGRYNYGAGSNIAANFGDWLSVYAGGGLIDIRNIKAAALAANDSTYLAIAQIWEAFTIGTTADMWGSVPYTQVGTSAQPDTDSQFAIYDSVQSLLTQAIRELGTGVGAGPGAADLVFGGARANWIKTAYTLKARYWMHVAEAAAAGKLPSALTAPQVYNNAIAAATLGISDPSGKSDFRSFHTTATSERNMWAQFQTGSGFGTDVNAGKPLADAMRARLDPRLPAYFCPNGLGTWKAKHRYPVGAAVLDPNLGWELATAIIDTAHNSSSGTQPTWPTTIGTTTTDSQVTWTLKEKGPPYGGEDFNAAQPGPFVSFYDCQPSRFADDFRVPYVTYGENQLILAEANHALGNDAAALAELNAQRTYVNTLYPATAPQVPLPALVGITGTVLLDSIMTDKWVLMFQTIETIMDYRRTCIPNVPYVRGNILSLTTVPGELFYPNNERNVNPQHIPTEGAEIAAGVRTEADVAPCPSP